VRALARSARRIPVDHPKLEKVVGDALEMATPEADRRGHDEFTTSSLLVARRERTLAQQVELRALTGVDVVIQSLGVSARPEVILKPTRFFSTATRVLITAMEEAQIKRLICVTGFGAGNSRGHGGFIYSAAFHLLLGRVLAEKVGRAHAVGPTSTKRPSADGPCARCFLIVESIRADGTANIVYAIGDNPAANVRRQWRRGDATIVGNTLRVARASYELTGNDQLDATYEGDNGRPRATMSRIA
jgi:hypothetical protein